MTDSISSISYGTQPYSASYSNKNNDQIESQPYLSQPSKADTARISAEALDMYKNSTKQESVSANSWQMLSGLKSGYTILANGHKQSVVIDGSTLELLEYDGDILVRSVTGEITESGATLDTTIFDGHGKKAQTINTVFETVEYPDYLNAGTSAKMSRDIQWFKDGDVTRTMTDSMQLDSSYNQMTMGSTIMDNTQAQSDDINKLIDNVTSDSQKIKYYASIQEYSNNQISKKIMVKKDDSFLNMTNRGNNYKYGLEARTTQDISHSKSLSIQMQNYDSNGDLTLKANFLNTISDGPKSDDGVNKQQISLSMYDKGELVEKSNSSMTLKESEGEKLAKSADLLQTLDLSEGEYITREPKSASELLAKPLMESSSKANFYTAAVQKDINGHALDSAEYISKYGENKQAHDISWESEIYENGEIISKQKHKESAVKNPKSDGLSFQITEALTENDNHQLINKNSHTLETYDNGTLKNRTKIESLEKIDEVENGPDKISTSTTTTDGTGGNIKRTQNIAEGDLAENDPLAHAASSAMGKEAHLVLEDSRKLFSSLDAENSGPKNNKYKVSFVPA
ncbi:hypothetical protein [Desulfovibrio sp. UCD-KL4C]|uniref:hypothetical protein n=1 Tax=Desulfovibrio sp. UCD-KL4C TaxID=2578120 RepID=UPI0025BC5B60|nr:hypothetical protein [Desulfovibrio sp. UCD-KL4C]